MRPSRRPSPQRQPSAGRGSEIFEVLEEPSWAPWLRFTAEQLDAQAEVFADGQILLCDGQASPIASLSTNRINWDGDIAHLPTWDEVAGSSQTYRDTYNPRGNTIVLMSGNVLAAARGSRLSDLWLEEIRKYATSEGIEQVIGPFRPSDYGRAKLTNPTVRFAAYCRTTRGDGLPLDGWLRSAARKDVRWLVISSRAMVVSARHSEFERFRSTFNPDRWRQVTNADAISVRLEEHNPRSDLVRIDEVWECGEAGTWYVDQSGLQAVYIESNLWGRLPL